MRLNEMMKKNSKTVLMALFKIVFFISVAFSLVNCCSEPTKESPAYPANNAEPAKKMQAHHADSPEPTSYYNVPIRDPGVSQSPINIFTGNSKIEPKKHQFKINFKDDVSAVKNLGHTVQLDLKQGSSVTYNGITYFFRQLHFHTPAEHQIDGITYPMEMHIVCSTDTPKAPSYVVITLLFKMGRGNEFIGDILGSVPREHNATYTGFNHIKLGHFLTLEEAGNLSHHYHYSGSLTTPPYTETVNWVIYKNIFEASPEQIMEINKLEGNNARHIQPVNSRAVEND
jgi:carbonic anhydrase